MKNEYGKTSKGKIIGKWVRIIVCVSMALSIVVIMQSSLRSAIGKSHASTNIKDEEVPKSAVPEAEITVDVENFKMMFKKKKIFDKYMQTVDKSDYMMHALGGMDEENTYINSLDAMEYYYIKGKRLFEVDVNVTKDDKLVLSHGWKKKDYSRHIGIDAFDEDKENEDGECIPTLDEFLSENIKDKYTTNSFSDLVEYMKEHDDVYVLIDIGDKDYDETLEIYKMIVKEVNSDDVLQHFIVGGQSKDMIKAVKKAYDFMIVNASYSEEKFGNVDKFLKYCEKEDITSYGIATDSDRDDLDKLLDKSDLISYVFTENEEKEAKKLLDKGVSVVGTDFLE